MSLVNQISASALQDLASSNDFDCLPRGYQVLELVRFLIAQGVCQITATEMSDLFRVMGMQCPRTTQPIRCSPARVADHVKKFIGAGSLQLRMLSADEFEV